MMLKPSRPDDFVAGEPIRIPSPGMRRRLPDCPTVAVREVDTRL